jgi:crotonobetainyl-CoA:carnitine CoA-transferase CaiB-like acyl-CoA transferase
MSETPCATLHPAPLLGQQSEQILGDLGYSASDIEAMREEKVI